MLASTKRRAVWFYILFPLLLCILLSSSLYAGTFSQVSNFGDNPGGNNMYKYVPENMPANAPLVVAVHGCSQDVAAYRNVGWEGLADQWKFYVMYPEQRFSNNMYKCFNWFKPDDRKRGVGESKSIESMINKMQADHSIDSNRVFIEGLSAGGYMAANMLASYPDIFKAGAVNAGGPAYCAATSSQAFDCMDPGANKSPYQWGSIANQYGYSSYGSWPLISIWHGTTDDTVKDMNMQELVEQWTNLHGIDTTADMSNTVQGQVHKEYHDESSRVVVETYSIAGMGHGTSVDPDFAPTNGCGTAGAYILDSGICAVYYIGQFWGLDNSDTEAPAVNINSPADGASVSGSVSVSTSASDNEEIDKVEFIVDDQVRATVTTDPYGFIWNTSQEYNGPRTLIAHAHDAAGNTADDSVTVTVSGGMADTTPPTITADPAGGSFLNSVTVSLSANEAASIYYTTNGSIPTTSSSFYSFSLTFASTTTLKFIGVDSEGNQTGVSIEQYNELQYDEVAAGTCTEHYNASRLDSSGYIACGREHGYMTDFTLYRFATCWTASISGEGCGVTANPPPNCQDWSTYNYYHKTAARSTGSYFNYTAVGSGDALGSTWTYTTLRQEDSSKNVFRLGACPQ